MKTFGVATGEVRPRLARTRGMPGLKLRAVTVLIGLIGGPTLGLSWGLFGEPTGNTGGQRAGAAEPPAQDDHRQLLNYRTDQGQLEPVRTPEDWQRRRADILKGMQEAMGPLPAPSNLVLDVRIEETHDDEGYQRLKITYQAETGDRVPAWLLLPNPPTKGRAPAVLALHQTIATGKDEVVGLGPVTNRRYGQELARRGYVVLAPDYPSFGEYPYDFVASGYASGTMKGIFNHMRAVDLLVSRAEVDPERIAVIGHSLGGHNSLFFAAFDERIKAAVTSCGWTPFHDYYQGDLKGWTSDRYMPRLRDVFGLSPDRVPFDFQEVLGAIAPRGVFSCSPLHDSNFEVAGVRRAETEVRKIYELLGAPDGLQVSYPDCEHDFPPEVRREAYEFLDRILSHRPRLELP